MSTALGRLIPNSADLFELAPLDAYEDEALTSPLDDAPVRTQVLTGTQVLNETQVSNGGDGLLIEGIADIAARVDSAPPPQYLARPVWVADTYGVLGAEDKAGKSWAVLDLSVAVAAGKAWQGEWPCEAPGRVLLFLGEGSERKTVRRLRAVCEFHGVRMEDLPIVVCHRAPNLTRDEHLNAITVNLAEHPTALVIVDPLYLAAGGADSSRLNEMGEVLGGIQHVCQRAGAALVVVHHWNQTGTGKDRSRFSGAGTAEWGRVLASVSVKERRTEADRTSVVTLEWHVIGDEIPDTSATFVRRVRADDENDLSSPMHYSIERSATTAERAAGEVWDGPTECIAAITAWFREHPTEESSTNAIVTQLRIAGVKYRTQTVRDSLEILARDDHLTVRTGPRNARLFRLKADDDLNL